MTDRLEQLVKVRQTFEDISNSPHWENHREYAQEDLKLAYELTDEQTYYLHQLVQDQFDPDVTSLYRSQWIAKNAMIVAQTITEALHQSLDGWSDGEKVIIELFLSDLGRAVKADPEWDDSEQYKPD